jgi:hypothetical protein
MSAGRATREGQLRETIRWGWVVACVSVGVALLLIAFFADGVLHWSQVATGTLTNVGTSFLVAAVLFFLERRFTARVAAQVDRVQVSVDRQLAEQDDRISTTLSEVRSAVDRLQEERNSDLDRRVSAIGGDVSQQTISEALLSAAEMGAIANGALTVPSDENQLGLSTTFAVTRQQYQGDGSLPDHFRLVLMATVNVERRPTERGTPIVQTEWRPEESPAAVADRLITTLKQRQRWAGPKTFDWARTIENLQRALQLATRARRGLEGSNEIGGALLRFVDDDWCFTSTGIESPTHRFVVPREDFPSTLEQIGRTFLQNEGVEPDRLPVKPDWVTAEYWEKLLALGRSMYARNV